MEDLKLIMNYVFDLLSIEIPIFGYELSILSIILSLSIMSLTIGFVVKMFGGH